MLEAIVINRLFKWAKWKMNSGVALGYKSQVSFTRLSGGRDPNLGYDERYDVECQFTERAVNLLPELHKALLRLEYLSTVISEDQKAYCFGTSRRTYRQYRQQAYQMLGNLLDSLLSCSPDGDINPVKCDFAVSE